MRSRLRDRVDYAVLPTGRETDVVESLSEGVIFNNLNEILDERINRMVVLRPTLTSTERLDALTSVLLFVGDQYDFHFDFADASDQVCTELFYRSFNGKGSIQLPLTRRFGRETLNADDIIRHHLSSNAFELILLVEPSNSKTRSARILFGNEAETRLISLMSASRP